MNYNPIVVTNMSLDGQATQVGYSFILNSTPQEIDFLRMNTNRNPPFIAQGAYIYNPNSTPVQLSESVTGQSWTIAPNGAATLNFAGAPYQKFTFSGSGTVFAGFTNYPQLANSFMPFSNSGGSSEPSNVTLSNNSLTPQVFRIAPGATSVSITTTVLHKIAIQVSPDADLATAGAVKLEVLDGSAVLLEWEFYLDTTASKQPIEFEYTWPAGSEYPSTDGLSITVSQTLNAGIIRAIVL